jgi:hypothetical protein
MRQMETSAFIDVAIAVGSSIVRYFATGNATPAIEGAPGWYPNNNWLTQSAPQGRTITADDLSAGSVRFVVVSRATGAGSGKLYASSDFPFYWQAINYGPVT